jgi:hypothetical protein
VAWAPITDHRSMPEKAVPVGAWNPPGRQNSERCHVGDGSLRHGHSFRGAASKDSGHFA